VKTARSSLVRTARQVIGEEMTSTYGVSVDKRGEEVERKKRSFKELKMASIGWLFNVLFELQRVNWF
jgi:hypothetical protein